ncbi:MAG: hypothetical protein ACRDMV_19535 [Streptosporangiales bacterium]
MPDEHHRDLLLTPENVRAWLGSPRLERYLSAVGGDDALALRLYDWNAKVAAAALVDVGHLEVALRNSYDRQLSRRYPGWAVDESEDLFSRVQGDPRTQRAQRTLDERSRREVTSAARGLGGNPSHGQVVAALSFGFWGQLTRAERTATFWTPMIQYSFPRGKRRGAVHALVQNTIRFRNRLAHNEPVFSTRTGLRQRLQEVRTLFELVHPQASAWTEEHSDVPALVAKCPVTGLIPTDTSRPA